MILDEMVAEIEIEEEKLEEAIGIVEHLLSCEDIRKRKKKADD